VTIFLGRTIMTIVEQWCALSPGTPLGAWELGVIAVSAVGPVYADLAGDPGPAFDFVAAASMLLGLLVFSDRCSFASTQQRWNHPESSALLASRSDSFSYALRVSRFTT
jgi:hypothetical protein